jgi:metal-responsive CopG/Arc/MetJ family transcriptional regulator
MKRVNYFLPEPLLEQLKKLADQRDVSVSELVRQAIQEFLKRQ